MEIQALRSGPLEDLNLAASISFPIDPAKVNENAIDDVSDLGQVGSDARGLEAIGHTLYGIDQPDAAPCGYLKAMASRVIEAARAASDEWNRLVDGGLSASYSTSQAGIEMFVNDVIATVGEAARYLGDPPPEIPAQDAEGRDIKDMRARLLGVQAVYSGAGGDGLSRLVELAFAATDERMTERLLAAIELLEVAPSKPTAEDYLAAYEAVAAVHRTLTTEIASQLGATLMFGDSDGDS
jgi:predicted lipoprotein